MGDDEPEGGTYLTIQPDLIRCSPSCREMIGDGE
jgi:hypothetical protein